MSIKFYTAASTLPASGEALKEVVGGKGAGLLEMAAKNVAVPPFAILPTSLCVEYMKHGSSALEGLDETIDQIIEYLTDEDGTVPLLSVRSGARVSMPGMMDTILNVGALTDECVASLDKLPERAQVDSCRRLLHMFGNTVLGLENAKFEHVMEERRIKASVETDAELSVSDLTLACERMLDIYNQDGKAIPSSLHHQIRQCIMAVIDSWESPRAIEYRKQNGIPNDWGTAVVIQRMVFGNMNDKSGSGVLFTRNPQTGDPKTVGEFLPNAQGEDVVAGIRTPMTLAEMLKMWPDQTKALIALTNKLEKSYKDMLDVEFTIEDGTLYMLQVRVGKRSARAAVQIGLDMLDDGWITPDTFRKRITRSQVKLLTQPVIDPKFKDKPDIQGIGSCSGVVSGIIALTPEKAVKIAESGKKCILVRHETSPDDIAGMFAAVGILTATGGTTSHAAVVARSMNTPCVVGASQLKVSETEVVLGGTIHTEGTMISIDGATGNVWFNTEVPVSDPTGDPLIARLQNTLTGPVSCKPYHPDDTGPFLFVATQFLGSVGPVEQDEATVIIPSEDEADAVLEVSEGFGLDVAIENMLVWATQNEVSLKLVGDTERLKKEKIKLPSSVKVEKGGTGIKGLLSRPVTYSELVEAFGDKETLLDLVGEPSEKFDIYANPRYEMFAAFEG